MTKEEAIIDKQQMGNFWLIFAKREAFKMSTRHRFLNKTIQTFKSKEGRDKGRGGPLVEYLY